MHSICTAYGTLFTPRAVTLTHAKNGQVFNTLILTGQTIISTAHDSPTIETSCRNEYIN
jgi:hypothetical protein